MTGLGRTIARAVAWTIMPVYIIGMTGKIWLESRLGLTTYLDNFMLLIAFGAFALVGALLVARRPANPVGWIMAAIGLMTGLFPAAETYAAYMMSTKGTPDPLAIFGAWANNIYWMPLLALALVYLPLLFPTGKLPSRRWLPVALISGVTVAAFVGIGAFSEILIGQDIAYQIRNPIGIKGMPAAEEHPLFPVLAVGTLIGLMGAVAAVIVRYRQSGGIERQQLKWFLYAAALIPTFFIVDLIPPVGDFIFGLTLTALPVAIGIAILRYRLWDIDLIIRRTLVYSILTLALLIVYFGSVVLLQGFVGQLAGEHDSTAVIVVSTLVIAALFTPLRRRIQAFIDRRFYRPKYNAERTLQDFAASLRDEVDLEPLIDNLIEVVQQTMQPEKVNLWIKQGNAVK
jgi:hypothetical protein